MRENCLVLKEKFTSLDQANEFLYNYATQGPKKKKKKKEITHKFNAVFYKLKN